MPDGPALSAPSLGLFYSGSDGPTATVLNFTNFLGVNHVFAGTAGDSFPVQGAALCCWIKTTQADPNAVFVSFGPTSGGNAGRLWITNPASLTIHFGVATGGVAATNLVLNDGVWRHLCLAVTPANRTHYAVQVWIDGILRWQALRALAFAAGGGLAAAGTFTLGLGQGSGETGLIGAVSELQLWSAGLTPASQAEALMRQRAADSAAGLVLHWPLDAAPPGNTIPPTAFIPSTLSFREPDAGQTTFASAQWAPVTGADSYELQVVSTDGAYVLDQSNITGAGPVMSAPLAAVLPGRAYQARVRGLTGASPGPWSASAALVPLDLPSAALGFVWPNQGALSAQWNAVDQAQLYQVALNGSAPSTQTGVSLDLSAQLTAIGPLSIFVRGTTAAASGASGAVGAGNAPGPTTKTSLGFYYQNPEGPGNGDFAFDWTPATPAPAFFYMEVSKAGTLIASGHVAGDVAPPALLAAPAPVQTGEQFTGRMRRIGQGVLADWDTQTATIHSLSAPSPQFGAAVPPATEAFAMTWAAVASGATYNLDTFIDGGGQPIHQTGVVSPYSLMSLLSSDALPANNHSYTFKLRAVLDGELGPPSSVVAPPVLTTSFQYVWNGGQDPGTLTVGWTPATGSAQVYVRAFQGSATTPAQYGTAPVAQGSFAVTPPVGGFVIGSTFASQIRALDAGAMTTAQFGQVVIHQLGTPTVLVARTQPGVVAVQAQWASVNPELTVSYLPVLNGTAGALQAVRTLDLSSHLDDAAALTLQVRAQADESYGPLSVSAAAPDLQLGFRYLLTASGVQSLTATWTAAPLVYLSILKTGATSADRQLFDDGTTARYAVPVPGGGFIENDVYTLSIKSAANGALGAMSVAPVTVHQLAQPAPAFQSPASAQPVTLQWADVRTQPQKTAGLAVSYQVAVNGVAVADQPTGLSYTLTTQLDTDGAELITVQPFAQGSWGVVSAPASLAAPAPSAISYDAASRQLTLAWPSVTGAAGYYVELRQDSDGSLLAKQWVAAPSGTNPVSASFDAASLALNASYTAKTRAMAAGAMSAFGSLSLTIKQLVGPSSVTLTPTFSQRQIATAWQFDASGLGTVTYMAELRQTDGAVLDHQTSSTTAVNLHYPTSVAQGTTLNVFVRATAGGNVGLWSTAQPVTIGSDLAQVTITSAAFDTSNNLTVTWNAVPGSGVKYQVQLTKASGGTPYTRSSIAGTSCTLNQSDTSVAKDTLYNIQVRATDPAPAGSWSAIYQKQSDTLTKPDSGGSGGSDSSGDPVVIANGWYSYVNVDMGAVGVVPLALEVHYNSFAPLPTDTPPGSDLPLGRRWTHIYTTHIVRSGDGRTAAVMWGDGITSVYDVPSSITGAYSKQGQPNGDLLVCMPNLALVLTRRDQTVYRFDASGTLQQIVSPQGNSANLTYQNGRLDRVTDQGSGRYLRFDYFTSGADAGRINTVTDNAGRSVSYLYTNGDLTTFTDVAGGTRQFTYHPGSLMWTATDQCGDTFITNLYDAQNRVIQQKDGRAAASGQNYFITFAYQDQTIGGVDYLQTTVTDRMGHVTVSLSVKVTLNTISESHTLANGDVWRVLRTFDGVGNLVAETAYQGPASGAAGVGATTTYAYDGARNLLSVTDPMGDTARFTYDGRNNMTGRTDAYGNQTTITYAPGTSLVQSITDPTGRKQVYSYLPVGSILGLPDTYTDYPVGDGAGAVGNVTSFQYQPTGETRLVTDPSGASILNGYDPSGTGWLTSSEMRDNLGAVAANFSSSYWPGTGLPQTTKVQLSNQPAAQAFAQTTVFDRDGMLTSVTDALQRTTTYHYDANSQLDSIIYPAVSDPDVTRYVRDRNDQVIQAVLSATGPQVQTGAGYDEIGRLTSTTDGAGNVTTIAWSMSLQPAGTASPVVATVTLPAVTINTPGQPQTTATYQQVLAFDPLGRLISRTEPAPTPGPSGPATTIAYAPVAGAGGTKNLQVTTTFPKADPSQPAAFQTIAVHDPIGRLLSWTDERGKVWTIAYTGQIDAATNTTQLVATTTDPVGNQTIEVTDAAGRPISVAIGKGQAWRKTSVSYDVLDRPVSIEEPNPTPDPLTPTVRTTVAYAYDAATQCVQVTVSPYQPASSRMLIDGAGQWVSAVDAHGVATSMTYTPRGQLLTYANGRVQTLTYGYDRAGRHVTTTPPDVSQTVEQVLDGAGNRLQTKLGGVVQITRTFDALNRMTSRANALHSETVAYSYTPTNAIATLLYPGETSPVVYGYDAMNRLRSVTDWASRATSYTYAPNGALATATLPNNVAVTFNEDDAGQFTGFQAAIGQDLLATAAYQLDVFGQPGRIDQLTPLGLTFPTGQTAYTYAEADRLTQVDGVALTYDGDGNVATTPGVAGALIHNIYNQLTQIGTAAYVFDVDGLLDSSTSGATARHYVQDPAGYANPMIARADAGQDQTQTLLAQLMAGGAAALPEPQALTSPWLPTAPMNRVLATVDGGGSATRYVHGVGLIGRETPDGGFQTYVFNGVGDTLALVGAAGLTDAYAYTPYGEPAGRQGTSDNPFTLHGRWGVITDPSGLCFMRARTYAPSLARFLERDPIAGSLFTPQTLNQYAFVPGNPLQFLDPLGLSGDKDNGKKNDNNSSGGSWWSSVGGVFTAIGIALGGLLTLGGIAVGIASAAAPAAFATGLTAGALPAVGSSFGTRLAFWIGRGALRILPRMTSSWLRLGAQGRLPKAALIELKGLLR